MDRRGQLAWIALFGCAAGCGSGSSSGAPASPFSKWFTDSDCPTRSLVEVARVPQAQFSQPGYFATWASGLSVAGGQLYFARSVPPAPDAGVPDGGLPQGQNWLTAVPIGGGTPTDVALGPSGYSPGRFFAVQGSTIVIASGGQAASVPLAGGVVSLPTLDFPGIPESDLLDGDFVYTAYVDWMDGSTSYSTGAAVRVVKTPIAGGPSTVLFEQMHIATQIGGLVNAGDAILVSLGWSSTSTTSPGPGPEVFTGAVFKIAKAGGAATRLRPDVDFADPFTSPWIGWDGKDIHGTVLLDGEEVRASVPVAGGPPVEEGIPSNGGVALQTAAATLVLQNLWNGSSRVALMTTAGGGSVIACSSASSGRESPVGVAADSTGTYVAYADCPLTSDPCALVLAKLGD